MRGILFTLGIFAFRLCFLLAPTSHTCFPPTSRMGLFSWRVLAPCTLCKECFYYPPQLSEDDMWLVHPIKARWKAMRGSSVKAKHQNSVPQPTSRAGPVHPPLSHPIHAPRLVSNGVSIIRPLYPLLLKRSLADHKWHYPDSSWVHK